jgi:Nucleoside-diphosphate-sugar epimerases
MNILLTGGSGFIGRNIREQLGDKYQILAPSHQELDWLDEHQVDRYFAENSIDVVIHSAVKPGHRNAKDPANLFYSNIRMYFNLARHADKVEKIIVLGSGAIYDTRLDLHEVSEDFYQRQLPIDDHGFCKYVCARDIENRKNITELRLFGVFGQYEDYAIRFISNAICKTLFDLPITIKKNRKFDYLFIDDLMPVIDYFIKNEPQYNAYNVTPDEAIELYHLAEIVRDISGKDLPIRVREPGMGLEYSGNNALIKTEMGDLCFTPIYSAVQHLYKWYEGNQQNINREYLLFDK